MNGYLTLKEIENRFGVKADTLRSYITRKKVIPEHSIEKVGNTWLVDQRWVLEKYGNDNMRVSPYLNDQGEHAGYYFIDKNSKREFYFDDGEKVDYAKLDIDDQNMLDLETDAFEDGMNPIRDGYETYQFNKFVIKRKIDHIEDFDGKIIENG